MSVTDLKVEKVLLTALAADPENVRKHGDRNIQAIKASLGRFGQQHPIIVDSSDVVRVGSGRLEAMRQLGWTECYVIRTNLPDSEIAAYAIADNRTSELASWDLDGLDSALKEISESGVKLEDIGFSQGDLEALLGPAEWKKAETTGAEPPGYQAGGYKEKIVVVVSDMTKRALITAAIKGILETQGWTDCAHVI